MSTKTLRVTLADIVGPTGSAGNSTATVTARYVDGRYRGRDVHLEDGSIVVPVRRTDALSGTPEAFEFTVYANDAAPVRPVDYGFLVEVAWTVVAPEGGRTDGRRQVEITEALTSPVQLGLLSTPTPMPPHTGGYVLTVNGTGPDPLGNIVVAGGGGSSVVQIGTLVLPGTPAVGESVTILASSATVIPGGVTWDTGGAPVVAASTRLLISFVWSGTDWVGTYGLPFAVPADLTAPSVPTGLSATPASSTSVSLSWTASTDAVGVTGYDYRVGGGTFVNAGAGTTETVTGLAPSTLYSFEVRAYDAAGNKSAWSTAASATTSAPPADVTPPTVGTLGMTMSDVSASGTVTGASDAVALHATPYSFRLGAGAWSAYQTSATYSFTGLTASTSYNFQHRTQDAAGNVSTGTVVTQSTTAGADVTPPTVGTLASSAIASTGFTLTVSGASDAGGLAAAPYSFSTDNGTTWTAYQSGATLAVTGKTGSTAYTCKHRVKDAAGNVSTLGTGVVVTTSAPGLTYIARDQFTKSDEAAIGTADIGGTWNTYTKSFKVYSNRVAGRATADVVASLATATADVDVSATMYWFNKSGLMVRAVSDTDHIRGQLTSAGLTLYRIGPDSVLGTYAMTPVAGTAYVHRIVANGTSLKYYLDGVERISVTSSVNLAVVNHGIMLRGHATTSPAVPGSIDLADDFAIVAP